MAFYFKIPPELVNGDQWSIIDFNRSDTMRSAVIDYLTDEGCTYDLKSIANTIDLWVSSLGIPSASSVGAKLAFALNSSVAPSFEVEVVEMTDDEVEALPDI